MGSRFGGLKQIEPIGPGGETIIDYSVFDAKRAGFGGLVFVIRRDIEGVFQEIIGSRFERQMAVDYVFQELNNLPEGFSPPSSRVKPWGTGHAVLMEAEAITGPFAVINGDDFYGRNSFELLASHLQGPALDSAMVGFILRNTMSEHGAVARGVCQVSAAGFLTNVVELTRIEKQTDAITHTDAAGVRRLLTGEEIVSLNMWGFAPSVFSHLQAEFAVFLQRQRTEDKAEFFLPSAVNNLIEAGKMRLKVLRTPDSWFGVTYREDRPTVVESIRALVKQGEYPERLWA